jgi:hypothetical protein
MKEKIELKYPIDIAGRGKTCAIELRRPKVKDLEIIDRFESGTEKNINLIAHLAEWTPDEVREIDCADYARIAKKIDDFLGSAP